MPESCAGCQPDFRCWRIGKTQIVDASSGYTKGRTVFAPSSKELSGVVRALHKSLTVEGVAALEFGVRFE
jgi:hypothetical protein